MVLALIFTGCPLPFLCLGQDTNASDPTRLEATMVTGHRRSLHDVSTESQLVGPANQPEWTARRVFAETDVYVIPTGQIEFNQFYISSHPRHEGAEHLSNPRSSSACPGAHNSMSK
jgi:hypothetical protein